MDTIEPAHIEQLYQRYFPIIRAKCTRMLRDPMEAQDIAQETFTRLWANRRQLRDREALIAWIYRTSTRLTIDRARGRLRLPLEGNGQEAMASGGQPADPPHCQNPEELAHWRSRMAFLSKIPAKELEVAIMSRIDGMTHPQIATATGRRAEKNES
jgi:RNA polymerase sigma-70 factor (ECF subfamily)